MAFVRTTISDEIVWGLCIRSFPSRLFLGRVPPCVRSDSLWELEVVDRKGGNSERCFQEHLEIGSG